MAVKKARGMSKDLFNELMQSTQEMAAILEGKQAPARVTVYEIPDVREVREKLELERSAFARAFGVSPRTVESWEQGRRRPGGAAGVLLRIANKNPRMVLQALKGK